MCVEQPLYGDRASNLQTPSEKNIQVRVLTLIFYAFLGELLAQNEQYGEMVLQGS